MNSTQWGIGPVTFVTRGHLWVLAKRAVGGLKFDHWGPFECELVHTPSAGGMREANVRLWGNKMPTPRQGTVSDSCPDCGSHLICAPCRPCNGSGRSMVFLKCKTCHGAGQHRICPNFLSHLRTQSASSNANVATNDEDRQSASALR
jgi:hypothetical protein